MATDVTQATLETVFRISIGKLRMLHNTSQSNVSTPVFRVSQTNGSISNVQRSGGLLRSTETSVSTANRLLRSLLITRIARKARSQLLIQQSATRACIEEGCSPTENGSNTTDSEHQASQFCGSTNDASHSALKNADTRDQTERCRKRFSTAPSDVTDHTATKQLCQRSELIYSKPDDATLVQATKSTEAMTINTELDTHSVICNSGQERRNPVGIFRDASVANRVLESTTLQRHVMNPRLEAVVINVTSAEQPAVCHVQSPNTVSHLTTVPYQLLPGVS
ncbi:hypothetical protein D915_003721 [Fasciola hepatica]|uniref:Uncharacterized protein n=1 Tax=Fasciola hepatica TaxID=6192 RepID=A0A4E0RVZ4_FASHE|nr:hypothetical protein D915_003721 [Fasciola hepatica]